ncbi:MAG: hypothetical protein H0X26_06755 [Alphaproteobacteria bacterium]|nr:hypothetical protein [Alphaproteobacteria bacterium]
MVYIFLRHFIFSCFYISLLLPVYSMEFYENLKTSKKYSVEKQNYDPGFFRKRTLSVIENLAKDFSQHPAYNDVKRSNTYIPNLKHTVYDTKLMNNKYSDEQVIYFTRNGLKKCQVYIVFNNIYRKDGTSYSSTLPLNNETGEGDMIIMDELGNVFIHPKKKGMIHHSSFFSGKPIAFAGLCFVRKGWLEELTTYSGHYTSGMNEIQNWLEAASQGHLKCSKYTIIEKNAQSFFILPSGRESTCAIFEDVGYLYTIAGLHIQKPILNHIDLSTGELVNTHFLPTEPCGMIKTQDHVTLLGIRDKQEKGEKKSWIYSFHKSSGDFSELSFFHNFSAIEPLGDIKGNKMAVFLGDYKGVIFVTPEEEKISIEAIKRSGKISALGGAILTINDYKPSTKKGEITIYGDSYQGGKVVLESAKFPIIKDLNQKIFYKKDDTCFVGYDLEHNLECLHVTVPAMSFVKNFMLTQINDQLWVFDYAYHSLQAYVVNGSVLSSQWTYKNPSQESFDEFEWTILSVDKNHKKLWGLPQQYQLNKVCCWDIASGQLEYGETLNLGKNAQIVSFNKEGIPIVHTHDPS